MGLFLSYLGQPDGFKGINGVYLLVKVAEVHQGIKKVLKSVAPRLLKLS